MKVNNQNDVQSLFVELFYLHDLTRVELSKRIGISNGSISDYINNVKKNMTVNVAVKLLSAFGYELHIIKKR